MERIIKRGKIKPANRRKNTTKKFSKVDSFAKDLIRRTVYQFYDNSVAPTLDMLYSKLLEKTQGEEYEFSCGRTTLSKILKSLGFYHCRNNSREVLMENPRIQSLRWKFLRKLKQLRAEGYTVVYLEKRGMTPTIPQVVFFQVDQAVILSVDLFPGVSEL